MKSIKLALSILLATTMLQAIAQTEYIHMGTSQDMLNGITVTWNGQGTADSIKWGYTTSYEKGQFLASIRASVTLPGNWFHYNFGSSITPSATIYYQIKDSKTATWGGQQKYHTIAAIPIDVTTTDFSFAVAGDCRDGGSEFTKVANSIYAKNPDFVQFVGDLTASGNKASEWTTWLNSADSLTYNKVLFQVEGNHDAKAPTTYLNTFDLPTNGDGVDYNYYSYTVGNALFIVLNFEYGDVAPNNPADWAAQTTWMTNLLNTIDTNKIKWKIVAWHEPYYTVGSSVGDMSYSGWWPIFDKYGIDLVLNCHDHDYQRFKPINQSISTTAPVSNYGSGPADGRCEIISGGAGAPLDAQTVFSSPFLQTFQSTNCFVMINETGCQSGFSKMHITAYNDAGTSILDSLTIYKACVPAGVATVKENGSTIKAIPNPATDEVTLQYTSTLRGDAIIKLFDANGVMVRTYNVKKDNDYLEHTFNLSGLSKGIYVLSVFINSQQVNIKVAKN